MNVELEQRLIAKIRQMSTRHQLQVERFIDSLNNPDGIVPTVENYQPDSALAQMAAKASEPSFAKIWDNPEDAIYDQL
jgi:hypothetical protein